MGEGSTVTVTQQTNEVSHIVSEQTSEGVSGWVCCSGADSRIRPWTGRSTSDVRAVMATNFAESWAVRKVSWRRNVDENPTHRDRPSATFTKRETISLVPRRQSSVTALLELISACHKTYYQGHLHTPLTEVLFKYRGFCTPMPLVRGRCRSLRVLVLLCRSSQRVVDRCGLQNEYPRQDNKLNLNAHVSIITGKEHERAYLIN